MAENFLKKRVFFQVRELKIFCRKY